MTKRERQLVVSTLGAVIFAVCIVGIVDFLINGRINPALTALFFILAIGSAPFTIPSLLDELNAHRPPKRGGDDPNP